jgi:hypothetical protein
VSGRQKGEGGGSINKPNKISLINGTYFASKIRRGREEKKANYEIFH